jgi:hypothetical protein
LLLSYEFFHHGVTHSPQIVNDYWENVIDLGAGFYQRVLNPSPAGTTL